MGPPPCPIHRSAHKSISRKFKVASYPSEDASITPQLHATGRSASKSGGYVVFVTPLCSKPLRLVTPQLPENFLRQRIRIGPTPAAARREPRRLKALSARPHRSGPVPSDRIVVITPFHRSTNICLYYCTVEPWHVSHCTRRVGLLTSQTSLKRRSKMFAKNV